MRLEDIHGVILAGGLGTRLRSVSLDGPKPMALVDGRPFVEWVARWLAASGIHSATVATGYRGDVIARYFTTSPLSAIAIDCVREEQPLGTAGGFLHAARASGRKPDAWLALNGDSLAFADLADLVAQLQDGVADAAIVGCRVADAGLYGRLDLAPDGRLRGFSEKIPDGHGPGFVNAGVYLIRDAMLERFPDRKPLSFEYDVFPAWLAAGTPVAVSVADVPFLDIGTPANLALADGFVRTHRACFA